MEALIASYGDTSSDSDGDTEITPMSISTSTSIPSHSPATPLPPPPLALLNPPNSFGIFDYSHSGQPNRVRRFPHVEGNFALHVYIPVRIPSASKKDLAQFLERVTSLVPGLHIVDADLPLKHFLKDYQKLEQVALGWVFHISLGRNVPIRVHQRESIVTMLRQKLPFQRSRYMIDFSNWEVFVNDDRTRTFLSLEVKTRGLAEITKQIQLVNEVYKLHNLPEFYKDPRPHISIAWGSGDISDSLKGVVEEETTRHVRVAGNLQKHIFTSNFSGIECKIGNKTFDICKLVEE